MSTLTHYLFVSALCLCFWLFPTLANASWELKKETNEVQIWQRKNVDNLWEIKATTTVNANIGALVNLLRDIKQATTWIDRCEKVELLSSEGDIDVVMTQFHSPWPFSNRIMLTQSTITYLGATLTIEVSDIVELDSEYAERIPDAYVKMRSVAGKWLVEPLDEGKIAISYQGTGDPAGVIPSWIARKAMVDSTLATFINLRTEIVKTKYQNKP